MYPNLRLSEYLSPSDTQAIGDEEPTKADRWGNLRIRIEAPNGNSLLGLRWAGRKAEEGTYPAAVVSRRVSHLTTARRTIFTDFPIGDLTS
jgi:hypothetical protein